MVFWELDIWFCVGLYRFSLCPLWLCVSNLERIFKTFLKHGEPMARESGKERVESRYARDQCLAVFFASLLLCVRNRFLITSTPSADC